MTLDTAPPLPFFGTRLKRLRKTRGLKQLALAHELGVDQATVSRWENGAQAPSPAVQRRALLALSDARGRDDSALRRLVDGAGGPVHLVEEATHICLAYSRARAQDWGVSQRAFLGVSLWPFATEEIRQAEAELAQTDWWAVAAPAPKRFQTSERTDAPIRISAGGILWERLYLNDGTPVRLVTGV